MDKTGINQSTTPLSAPHVAPTTASSMESIISKLQKSANNCIDNAMQKMVTLKKAPSNMAVIIASVFNRGDKEKILSQTYTLQAAKHFSAVDSACISSLSGKAYLNRKEVDEKFGDQNKLGQALVQHLTPSLLDAIFKRAPFDKDMEDHGYVTDKGFLDRESLDLIKERLSSVSEVFNKSKSIDDCKDIFQKRWAINNEATSQFMIAASKHLAKVANTEEAKEQSDTIKTLMTDSTPAQVAEAAILLQKMLSDLEKLEQPLINMTKLKF